MIGATRPSSGFSITSRPTPSASEARSPVSEGSNLRGKLENVSQNPVLRSLLGESAFDGVLGKGQADKSEKAQQAGQSEKPEEGLNKLIELVQQLVTMLQSILGKQQQQPGQEAGSGSEQGTAPASGASGSQGASPSNATAQPQGASPSGAADESQQAAPAQGAEESQQAAPAEEQNPLEQIFKVLQQVLQLLQQLKGSMGGQQGGSPGAEQPQQAPGTVEA